MTITILSIALIFTTFLMIAALFRCQKLDLEGKRKDDLISNLQSDFQALSVETKHISSLSKMAIEKWEQAVLDNVNLQNQNLELTKYINNTH